MQLYLPGMQKEVALAEHVIIAVEELSMKQCYPQNLTTFDLPDQIVDAVVVGNYMERIPVMYRLL